MIVADASDIVPLVIQRHDLGRASETLLEASPELVRSHGEILAE